MTPYNREALWSSGYNTSSELYQFTALMNKLRKHAITVDQFYVDYQSQAIYEDDSTIVLRKGMEGRQIIAVLSNSGNGQGSYDLSIPNGYVPGQVAMDVVTCTNITVNSYGELVVPMGQGLPHIFFPADRMNGSQICGMANWTVSQWDENSGSIESSGVVQKHSLISSSIAMSLAFLVAFCLF